MTSFCHDGILLSWPGKLFTTVRQLRLPIYGHNRGYAHDTGKRLLELVILCDYERSLQERTATVCPYHCRLRNNVICMNLMNQVVSFGVIMTGLCTSAS
jgi:hypothetical protein